METQKEDVSSLHDDDDDDDDDRKEILQYLMRMSSETSPTWNVDRYVDSWHEPWTFHRYKNNARRCRYESHFTSI